MVLSPSAFLCYDSCCCRLLEKYGLRSLRKIFKECCMLYCMLCDEIIAFLRRDGGPCTQKDIARHLSSVNRAVLLGYLRCLVDVGKIKSRESGKAKVYYL